MLHWFHKAIVYHIFIDRFNAEHKLKEANEPRFCGGNLKGIIEKIEHFEQLQVNTIWLSPFFKSNAYHGYHITNFAAIDKRFGTIKELEILITECKKNGIRIIVDVVPNHCSVKHPWFVDASSSKNSPYRNWFYFDKSNNYLDFMGFSELAKLNLEYPDTEEWILACLCNWAQMGIDGFRVDHVLGIPDTFLIKLNKRLKDINPDFLLLGEAWGEGMKYKHLASLRIKGKYSLWKKGFNQVDIQKHYEGILDGVLDFGWRNLLLENIDIIRTNPERFAQKSLNYSKQFSSEFFLPRFLDNHDTARIMYHCNNNMKLFTSLLNILFSQEQAPIIYYGTEAGLSHSKAVNPMHANSDLQARGLIDWKQSDLPFSNLINKLAKERQQRFRV